MAAALAQQLLDAHVAHILERCNEKNLPQETEKLIDQVLEQTGGLKLSAVVSKKDVKNTAIFFAAKMDIGPGIPELVAGIARELHGHKAHDKATLNDLVSDRDFDELLDKYDEMELLRERIIHEIVSNPVYTALISDLLYNGITRYINDNPLSNKLPGAKSMLKFGKSLADRSGVDWQKGVRAYIKHNTRAALRESERFLLNQLSDEKLRDSAHQTWDRIKNEPVSRFRDYVSADDVEEFFVIGFEFWRNFRQTAYYSDLICAAIDFFFKEYGKKSLNTLLNDLGVTRDMIVAEAQRYAPRAVKALNKEGVIEAIAREQLRGFYESEVVAQLLSPQ